MKTLRNAISYSITTLIIFFALPQIAFAIDGETITRMVYDRNDGKTSYAVTQMQLIDKRGRTKRRILITVTKDYGNLKKTYTRFSSPPDIKGTVFLVWENTTRDDDQFLYLPALKRVRRIVSRQKKSRFVNSEFTYEDMQRKKPEESTHTLLRSAQYDNRTCWVVESIPHKGTSQYKKWVSWVDKEYLMPLKIEYYSKRGKLFKRYKAGRIKKIGDVWTAMEMEMHDLKKKRRTRMKIKKMQYNRPIKDRIFTKSYVKKGR